MFRLAYTSRTEICSNTVTCWLDGHLSRRTTKIRNVVETMHDQYRENYMRDGQKRPCIIGRYCFIADCIHDELVLLTHQILTWLFYRKSSNVNEYYWIYFRDNSWGMPCDWHPIETESFVVMNLRTFNYNYIISATFMYTLSQQHFRKPASDVALFKYKLVGKPLLGLNKNRATGIPFEYWISLMASWWLFRYE